MLSSSWRQNMEAKAHLRKVLEYYDIPLWVSQTPSLGVYARGREILTWVKKYQPKEWVCIDDWALMCECPRELAGHFNQTNPKCGLTQKDVNKISKLFSVQRKRREEGEGAELSPDEYA